MNAPCVHARGSDSGGMSVSGGRVACESGHVSVAAVRPASDAVTSRFRLGDSAARGGSVIVARAAMTVPHSACHERGDGDQRFAQGNEKIVRSARGARW